MEFLQNVLSTTLVSGFLISAVAWLLRSWITERLKSAIRHEYDKDIEAYKSVLAHVHAATAEGQKATIEARMKAFDRIWRAMLALRNTAGGALHFLDILTVDEYASLKNKRNFQSIVKSLDDDVILAMMPDKDVEQARPYVGESVWLYFFAYQAFNLRVMTLIKWSENGDQKINWHKDNYTRKLLAMALTPDQMAAMDALEIGKLSFVRQAIEARVIVHWHALLSGKEFGDEAVKQAQSMLVAISQMNGRA